MKLLSLNIALFEANNSKLLSFLQELNADIVCLQEVTRGLEESVHSEYVSKNTVDLATPQLKYFFFAPSSVMGDFEQKGFHGKELFHFEFGGLLEFGNYIKSRYKIIKGQYLCGKQLHIHY